MRGTACSENSASESASFGLRPTDIRPTALPLAGARPFGWEFTRKSCIRSGVPDARAAGRRRHPRLRGTRPTSNGYPDTSAHVSSVGQSVRGRSHEQQHRNRKQRVRT